MADKCASLPMFARLEGVKESLSTSFYDAIAPQIVPLVSKGLILYLVFVGILVMVEPGTFRDRVIKAGRVLFAATIISAALSTTGAVPAVQEFIIGPLERLASNIGLLVFQQAEIDADAGNGSVYGSMACTVEKGIFHVVQAAWHLTYGIRGEEVGLLQIGLSQFIGIIAAIGIIAPFVFVAGIFAAYLVEALFKYYAISMLSPLLVGAWVFPFLRPFSVAALRVLLGASLTVIFAAFAMAFSIKMVGDYGDKLRLVVDCASTIRNPGELACRGVEDFYSYVFGAEYLALVIVGFVAILLHLKAASLASNISGAQDSAAAAGATVAGMMKTLEMGWNKAKSVPGLAKSGYRAANSAFGALRGGGKGGGQNSGDRDISNQFIGDGGGA